MTPEVSSLFHLPIISLNLTVPKKPKRKLSAFNFFFRDELRLSRDDFATEQDVLDAATATSKGLKIETDDGSILLNFVHRIDGDDFVLV